eukprot:ctg_190.g147
MDSRLTLAELVRLRNFQEEESAAAFSLSQGSTWSRRRQEHGAGAGIAARERLDRLVKVVGHLPDTGRQTASGSPALSDCSWESDTSDVTHGELAQDAKGVGPARRVLRGRRTGLVPPRRLRVDVYGLEDVREFWTACRSFRVQASAQRDGGTAAHRPQSAHQVGDSPSDPVAQALQFGWGGDAGCDDVTSLTTEHAVDAVHVECGLRFRRGRKRAHTAVMDTSAAAEWSPRVESPNATKTEGQPISDDGAADAYYEQSRRGSLGAMTPAPDSPQLAALRTPPPMSSFLSTIDVESPGPMSSVEDTSADAFADQLSRSDHDERALLEACAKPEHAATNTPKPARRPRSHTSAFMKPAEIDAYLANRTQVEVPLTHDDIGGVRKRRRFRVLRFWRGETVEYEGHGVCRLPTIARVVVAPASPVEVLPCMRRYYRDGVMKSGFRSKIQSRLVSPERARFYANIQPPTHLALA